MVNSSHVTAKSTSLQQGWRRKLYYAFLAIALFYIILTGLIATLTRNTPHSKRVEDEEWIASSKYWLDRQLCRWIGCCGTFHMLNHAGWVWRDDRPEQPVRDFKDFWHSGRKSSWSAEEVKLREIPQYVFDHAPYVHLASSELYWPSDIAEHVVHMTPYINHTFQYKFGKARNLDNLMDLNHIVGADNGRNAYLHSDDNVELLPDWLTSGHNKPVQTSADCHTTQYDDISRDGRCGRGCNVTCEGSKFGSCCSTWGWCGSGDEHCAGDCNPASGKCYGPVKAGKHGPHIDLKKRGQSVNRRSNAPTILVVVPKDNGIVDAFWFFFYSYNKGKKVLNIQFGNHVGDWEHTMIRFKRGIPYQVYVSEHSWGEAFAWDALEKYAPSLTENEIMLSSWKNVSTKVSFDRPVVYSAEGSHAMYVTPDYHSYVAPFGILHDDTDRGPLWDPSLNVKSFTYDHKAQLIRSSTLNPDAPTSWFDYAGRWGDRYYLLDDPRQYRFAGEYHYVNGPLGPKFKNLGREHACLVPGDCKVRQTATALESAEELHVLHSEVESAEDGD